jgi:hypothetical protein
MHSPTPRRLALLPVETPRRQDRPVIRRYKLARVIDAGFAAQATAQAPTTGVRSP